jgi:BirA family biotin operon repressor/biotin-[acetyl-CoA-carboxylase] ligase
LSIDWTIQTPESVHSTQDPVKELAENGIAEGAAVHALTQTGGRGRHGRSWVSEHGNLYLSVLLRPLCPARQIGQLSILIAVALADTIRAELARQGGLMLKWPNDILLDGRKCAGILIETGLSDDGMIAHAVLGVGVNITHAPPKIGAFLNEYSLSPVDIERFRDRFLENLGRTYTSWKEQGFEDIRRRWLALAHQKGANMQVRIGEQVETGAFQGIDDDGNLQLLSPEGREKKVTAGEVYLINCGS